MKKIVPVLFLAGILVLALALNLTVLAAPAPDDPETYANLLTAVERETDAAAFYRAAGLKALDDGYPTIAKLFFATADAEAKHADDLWAILEATGAKERPTAKDPTIETTPENLQKAISAENYESEVMYPAFLPKAVLDGKFDAATLFAYYIKAEKNHEGNFSDVQGMLLADKDAEIDSKYAVIYRCPICGEIVLTRPDSCATCESSGAGYIAYNQTYANLYAAVHGETNAAAFYIASAAKALTDGYPVIAQLFQATADAEIKHAADEWAVLVKMGATAQPVAGTPTVGTTLENLKQAFDGETYENGVMYPKFRTVAITESETDAAEIFNWAMQAEGVHAVNYLDVRMMLSAENVDGINSKYAKIYRCKVCGEVVTTLPANCPICGRPGSTFEVYELFTVEAIAGVNGSITPSGIVYIPKGMSQSFIFTPDAVHEIDQIFIDDELYNDDSVKDLGDYDSKTCTYTFIDVESSHTIEATFKRITYTIEVSVGSNGSIDPSDDVTVPHGDDQTFAFLPISGYGVDQILIDGKAYIDESVKDLGEYDSETCTYTFISVEVNHTIHVTFKRIFYIVTATANEGGSIEPEGEVEVALDEDSPKIEFKAAPGFVIDKLIINGEDENIFSGYAGGWIIFESADFEEDGDITLEVVFKPSLDFNITTATGANGHMLYVDIDGEYEDPLDAFTDLDPNDTINVEQGRVAAFMIVPDAGYTINQISIDDKLYSSPDNKDTGEVLIEDGYTWYIFYGVQSDHAISVTFKSTGSSSGGGGSGTASYTVTFNSNGGSAVTSSTVAANTKVAKPADPSKEGFIFDGWFTASDLNAAYNFDTPVTKSFTLYAKWIEDEEKGEGDDFPFTDVLKSAWYYDYIKSVYELGLMNGTGDTLFSPAMPVTRGMLVTVLHRMEDTPEAEEPASFSDVAADTWYTDAVAWAEAEGIVEGYPDGTFKPNQNVSRQELATVLLRYAKFIGKDQSSAGPDDPVRDDEDDESEADEEEIEAVTAIISDDLDFADAAKIADWAKEGVAFCAKNGIIEGRTGKIFDPAAFATRAEFATMLHRFIENVVN